MRAKCDEIIATNDQKRIKKRGTWVKDSKKNHLISIGLALNCSDTVPHKTASSA